ncbi:MAG: phage head-tail connector protein [Clostridia bacterium]|nr:phage head-tail connector protein [Clostridia bacterium]
MTEQDKLSALRVLLGVEDEEQDVILSQYLRMAQAAMADRLYPFSSEPLAESIPSRYAQLQVEIAQFLYLKAGAEGQVAHSENGVSRSYRSDGIPESLLGRLTPFVGVL